MTSQLIQQLVTANCAGYSLSTSLPILIISFLLCLAVCCRMLTPPRRASSLPLSGAQPMEGSGRERSGYFFPVPSLLLRLLLGSYPVSPQPWLALDPGNTTSFSPAGLGW